MTQTFGPYRATVEDIHDGDTFTLAIDFGFGLTGTYACRLFGVNAPELNTDAGKASLAYLKTILHVGDVVTVLSHGWDKYGGRFDGQVTLPSGDLSGLMVKAGQALYRNY